MQSNAKTYKQNTNETPPFLNILTETIKTGIIKSNLFPMFAGLTLSLYTYGIHPFEKIGDIILATIGSILVMGAAGAFNNLYDRDIDSIMERTKNRPTVTGAIQPKTVGWLGGVMAAVGILALYFATPLAAVFGFLGLFLYVVPYTIWTKRRTIYNTEIGSLSGAVPPLIGWSAMYPDVAHPAIWGLFLVMVIWQMPHFYAIAIRNHEEYRAAKVPMRPVVKGLHQTYVQTNVYLLILFAASFLFAPLSVGIMLVALLLSIAWLLLSLVGFKKMDGEQWAKAMFLFSLFHMTFLFSTIILYSLIGIFILG